MAMDTWLDDDDSIGQHDASGASSSSSTSAALPDTRPVKGVQFMRKDSWLDMEDFARSTGKSSSRLTDPLTTLIGSIGPQNAEELVLSPLDFVTTLCEKEEAAFQQLVHNMQNLGFHSHFSGCNFDYMATMFFVATKEDLACEVQRLAARLQIGFSLEEVSTLASEGGLAGSCERHLDLLGVAGHELPGRRLSR